MEISGLTPALRRTVRRLLGREGVIGLHVLDYDANHPGLTLLDLSIRFAGREWTVTVRDQTTDLDLIDMLLTNDSAYRLPSSVEPRVIFDVGANIGIAALYFTAVYPNAEVHCFEPLPQNVDLLRRNVDRNSDLIAVHPVGLSDAPGTFTYHLSANSHTFGGGTFHRIGADTSESLELPVISVAQALRDAGVDHVDVFKIDTEGAEWPILKAVPPEVRRRAQAYVGELHGLHDWDLCNLLAETHDLDLDKRLNRNCHPFLAVRHDLAHAKPLAA